jgi:hypothetical protein
MTPEHFRDWLDTAIQITEQDVKDQEESIRMKTRTQGKLVAYRAVLQQFKQVDFDPANSTEVHRLIEDEFEKIELTTNDGDFSDSGQEVIWSKCCDKLDNEIRTWNAPKRSDRFFDVYVNGLRHPFIGTKHTSGHWQLHYCPYCGEKINIKFKHPF